MQLRHKGDMSLPVHDSFVVKSVGRQPSSKFSSTALGPPPKSYEQSWQKGRAEMGSEFYGVVRYALTVMFGPENSFTAAAHKWKDFSIDKRTARAPATRSDFGGCCSASMLMRMLSYGSVAGKWRGSRMCVVAVVGFTMLKNGSASYILR